MVMIFLSLVSELFLVPMVCFNMVSIVCNTFGNYTYGMYTYGIYGEFFDKFLTYNLLFIASFRIGVPSILLVNKYYNLTFQL